MLKNININEKISTFDSRVLNPFWAKLMDTTNYFQNQLPIKCKNKAIIISKKG